MIDWIRGWQMAEWAFAWAVVVGFLVVIVVLFGRDTVKGWVEHLYRRFFGGQP